MQELKKLMEGLKIISDGVYAKYDELITALKGVYGLVTQVWMITAVLGVIGLIISAIGLYLFRHML
jgi:hypothetical protein